MKVPLILNSFLVSELINKIEVASKTGADIILSINKPSCYDPNTALAFHDLIRKYQAAGSNIRFETSGLITLNELIIMLAVKKENRKMGPNAYLRFSASISGSEVGTVAEQVISFENSTKLRDAVVALVAEFTDLDVAEVKERSDKQELLSANEAAALGIF